MYSSTAAGSLRQRLVGLDDNIFASIVLPVQWGYRDCTSVFANHQRLIFLGA